MPVSLFSSIFLCRPPAPLVQGDPRPCWKTMLSDASAPSGRNKLTDAVDLLEGEDEVLTGPPDTAFFLMRVAGETMKCPLTYVGSLRRKALEALSTGLPPVEGASMGSIEPMWRGANYLAGMSIDPRSSSRRVACDHWSRRGACMV
ncbi:hypothetical protein FB451DRAFT_1171155 [Mycena latifolia]|nr:hypothetical protein FB451DRAFT_1171155 [Mycena latifolia]